MAIQVPAQTDTEIATGITTAISDLNKYLGLASAARLRVDIDYHTIREVSSMTRYNADICEARERDLPPVTHNLAVARSAVPAGFALYLGDIQDSLLTASAASDALIQAKFDGDIAAMAQNCAVVLAETRSAAALASHLGKHISAHQRRHEGVVRQ